MAGVVKVTSEFLREIKTVRQFAMEDEQTASCERVLCALCSVLWRTHARTHARMHSDIVLDDDNDDDDDDDGGGGGLSLFPSLCLSLSPSLPDADLHPAAARHAGR